MVRTVPILEFANPTFNSGWNVTVRKGRKWLHEPLARLRLSSGALSQPVPLRTELRRLSDLKDDDVKDEHDPACRTVPGLIYSLRLIYGDIQPDGEVTLCSFYLEEDSQML